MSYLGVMLGDYSEYREVPGELSRSVGVHESNKKAEEAVREETQRHTVAWCF